MAKIVAKLEDQYCIKLTTFWVGFWFSTQRANRLFGKTKEI